MESTCGEAVRGRVVYKMTGSGNDFVMVDGRTSPLAEWTSDEIQSICDRRAGLGADGLAVLEPGSKAGHVRFHFFNNNGNRADMCGNASLCATRLAARLELGRADGMVLETDVGPIETRVLPGPGDRAEISLPQVICLGSQEITLCPGELSVHLLMVGVPHLVLEVERLEGPNFDVVARGRELRSHHSLPQGGANVNFVAQKGAEWHMRSYERGVEAETLACGTGAVAVAATLAREKRVTLPWKVYTASGKPLEVSGQPTSNDSVTQLAEPRLGGEARAVYRAVLV